MTGKICTIANYDFNVSWRNNSNDQCTNIQWFITAKWTMQVVVTG